MADFPLSVRAQHLVQSLLPPFLPPHCSYLASELGLAFLTQAHLVRVLLSCFYFPGRCHRGGSVCVAFGGDMELVPIGGMAGLLIEVVSCSAA